MKKLPIILILAALFIGIILFTKEKPKTVVTKNQPTTTAATTFQQHIIEPLNLSFKTPKDFFVTTENAMNLTTNEPYAYTFYIQNYKDTPTTTHDYQLYGIYQFDTEKVEEKVFDDLEKDMMETKRTTIAGLPAISGFNKGQRQRYVIYILKDGHLLTLATAQADANNIKITEEIVKTFSFK